MSPLDKHNLKIQLKSMYQLKAMREFRRDISKWKQSELEMLERLASMRQCSQEDAIEWWLDVADAQVDAQISIVESALRGENNAEELENVVLFPPRI